MAALNDCGVGNISTQYRCKFQEDYKHILLPAGYGLVFLVGLVLNAVALYAMLFRIKRWNASTIFMVNLTACDTLYILTLPFLIYYYADKNDWHFGEPFCKIIRFLFYANLYGSILFLTCISVHRFMGVCHPVRSMHWVTAHRARLLSVAVWAIVLIFQAPVFHFARTTVSCKESVCHDTTPEKLFDDFWVYSSVVSVVLFAFPFCVVLVCSGLMVRALLKGGGVGGSTSLRSKKKSARTIVLVMLAFMVCFLPFHITRGLYYWFRHHEVNCILLEATSVAYKVMRPLVSVNSCIDPILYLLAGQGFRSLSKRATKSGTIAERKSLSTAV
ncbi:P2Y purinoceptor 2 isoform X2 [Brachyhypopomus gauderio]